MHIFFQDSLTNRKFKRTASIWNRILLSQTCFYCHFWSIYCILAE